MKLYPSNVRITKDHRRMAELLSKDENISVAIITRYGSVKILDEISEEAMCGMSCALIFVFKPISEDFLFCLRPCIVRGGIIIDYSEDIKDFQNNS